MCLVCDVSVLRLATSVPGIISAGLHGTLHLGYCPLCLAIKSSVFGSNPVSPPCCVTLSYLRGRSEAIGKRR